MPTASSGFAAPWAPRSRRSLSSVGSRPELGLVLPCRRGRTAVLRRTVSVLARGDGQHDRQRCSRLNAARRGSGSVAPARAGHVPALSLIHLSEPTRLGMISYAVFCL